MWRKSKEESRKVGSEKILHSLIIRPRIKALAEVRDLQDLYGRIS
jgi:hypothetical protein